MVKCIVVDDEPLARQLIMSYIEQVPGMQCMGSCENAMEALLILTHNHVDVMFIDIEMPGLSGLNLIKSLKVHPKVVFITAYTEYAVDAFEIEAIDYLVKPVTFERFLKTTQKLIIGDQSLHYQQNPQPLSIFLKVDKRLVQVELAAINYVESWGDYIKVHSNSHTYVTYMPLSKLEELLPVQGFIRIHRSTIINKSMITYIEGNFVRINGVNLAIGSTYKDELMKSLREVR